MILEVPGAKVLNTQVAAPYPLGQVLAEDFKPNDDKLGIACCYAGKLPQKVREISLVRLVGTPTADEPQMAGPSIELIVDGCACWVSLNKNNEEIHQKGRAIGHIDFWFVVSLGNDSEWKCWISGHLCRRCTRWHMEYCVSGYAITGGPSPSSEKLRCAARDIVDLAFPQGFIGDFTDFGGPGVAGAHLI